MKVTRTSLWSGITRSMELDITSEQYKLWQDGLAIQRAMPHLTPSEREFLISGMTDDEWYNIYNIGDE